MRRSEARLIYRRTKNLRAVQLLPGGGLKSEARQPGQLGVRKRRKGRNPNIERVPLQAASKVNQTWTMDFVSDSLCSGRRIKLLTAADDFSRECATIAVYFGIGGE